MKISTKVITRKFYAQDVGMMVIIVMYANLPNAMCVAILFLLIPNSVLHGKLILSPVLDGFIHHFANNLKTRRMWYQERPQ
jgi:hypothetical protein